jgi:hypothetical protein
MYILIVKVGDPKDLADSRGIEPLPTVLETVLLPLHQEPMGQFRVMPRTALPTERSKRQQPEECGSSPH